MFVGVKESLHLLQISAGMYPSQQCGGIVDKHGERGGPRRLRCKHFTIVVAQMGSV